tara:strand:+ start:552 stop:2210 length:1659 start_codon:yes stop_codon:yes gene_type:complete
MTTNIKDYSTTQASNTSLNGISVAEGMLPSNLNNAIRALMKNTRDWFNDAQWIEYGDGSGSYTAAYVSATSFTIAGTDVTSVYHAGRRIKLTATTPGTIFGTISSSSFSTNTTVVVTWDSGSLANESIDNVYIGALSKTNTSIPEDVITSTQLADDSVTSAKIVNGTIVNADINASAAIDATKIHDGTISNTEFGYLNGVTSAIQTQLDAKQATITGGASTIASADLTASRALESNASGKVAVSSVTSTELGYLSGVSSAIQTQLGTKLTASNNLSDVSSASSARTNLGLAIGTDVQAYDAQLADIAGLSPTDSNFIVGNGSNFVLESGATARTSLGLGTMATQASDNVSITGGAITGMSAPSAGSDVTTKTYVDDLVAGLKTRIITRVATTANVNLSNGLENGDTLDGISLVTGDKVLVKDQTDATENGIYLVPASGAASRDPDFNTVDELAGQLVIIQEGTTNEDTIFLCTTDTGGTIGSVNITFSQVQPQFTGTVSSVAVADAGSSEFTVTGSPITTSGTINLAVNNINVSKITDAASKGFATAMAIAL